MNRVSSRTMVFGLFSLLVIAVGAGVLPDHEGGIVFFLLALVMLAPVLFLLRRSELRPAQRHGP